MRSLVIDFEAKMHVYTSNFIVSFPRNILCLQGNYTSGQILRNRNRDNGSFEEVVFPGNRLVTDLTAI